AVLARLPERCRALLRRLLAEDASYEELAEEYGVARGTIKSRVARCREHANALRRRMGGSP
ncbi:RNA polymerase subunit sigma-70, partial [bacterium]|nr:RNA polymerase subunit sigma-70 [bacterium]